MTRKGIFTKRQFSFWNWRLDPDVSIKWNRQTIIEMMHRDLGLDIEEAKIFTVEIENNYGTSKNGDFKAGKLINLLHEELEQRGIEPKIELTENAILVLKRRYLKKGPDGEPIETPRELFRRVAGFIATADLIYNKDADIARVANKFYWMMANLYFMPNSPTLMNAGRELGQLSACFVLPVGDSMEEIFTAIKNAALIHKSGGGTGFSFSRIRPKNDRVKSTMGISSGPVSFMRVFDVATETIKQGGTRRGANMGVLRIDHPDILEFIRCKEKEGQISNFNISVAITEQFMRAYLNDEEYDLINPRNGTVVKRLKAKEVFDEIVDMAWKTGDPGIIFIDRINEDNPTPHIGEIESTNPCGEQPLLPFESCNLGSINLSKMVKDGAIDYDLLGEIVDEAVHFLDNVIDLNKYPLPEIERMTKANRKIGLGVMGFADMLFQLEIPYNSKEALKIADEVMGFIDRRSKEKSKELAEKRGPFPNFEGSIYDRKGMKPLRNATTTTIAPTGTISIISGCSSGIEPIFALAFTRNVMDNDKLTEINPYFLKRLKEVGLYRDEIIEKVIEEGTVQHISSIPEDIRRVFVVAHDIDPFWHVKIQAEFQKHVDNAVSKTINFPNKATREDVKRAYMMAYKSGCKGITIYRDGCKSHQVLTTKKSSDRKEPEIHQVNKLKPKERPDCLMGFTQKIATGCGNMYVTINEDNDGPFELFSSIGKTGACVSSQTEAISRLISLALRAGIDPETIINQLSGVRCHRPKWMGGIQVLSCADGIARALRMHLEGKLKPATSDKQLKLPLDDKEENEGKNIFANVPCPECGNYTLQFKEGCVTCICGFSECS